MNLDGLYQLVVCAAVHVWLLTPSCQAADADLLLRVVDVGAGECCIAKLPGGHYIIYDAGNYQDGGKSALKAIHEFIPKGSDIELLVLSHTDADHVAAVPGICADYHVKRAIRSGFARDTDNWRNALAALKEEHDSEGALDINLAEEALPPGATYQFGETFATMVSGFSFPPDDWDLDDEPERMNAGSIVIRLLYRGRSIILCGDAVGRHIGDPDNTCLATEKYMLDRAPAVPIDSDVLVAPHHGADNGSSAPFIKAVSPEFVIFSAGHRHAHPRADAVQRYLDSGMAATRIFRTDLGDDEGVKEWDGGRVPALKDGRGDDDIDVVITSDGKVSVAYRSQN
ncbi:MAG: ComEC/Rec2 family competence protein [Candidatus Sumerlaeaceae bacterium]